MVWVQGHRHEAGGDENLGISQSASQSHARNLAAAALRSFVI